MREIELRRKRTLYRVSKAVLTVAGAFLVVYGCYFIVSQYIVVPRDPLYWFGIFPAYVGSMMILISLAMKLEWFTNVRRFW